MHLRGTHLNKDLRVLLPLYFHDLIKKDTRILSYTYLSKAFGCKQELSRRAWEQSCKHNTAKQLCKTIFSLSFTTVFFLCVRQHISKRDSKLNRLEERQLVYLLNRTDKCLFSPHIFFMAKGWPGLYAYFFQKYFGWEYWTELGFQILLGIRIQDKARCPVLVFPFGCLRELFTS